MLVSAYPALPVTRNTSQVISRQRHAPRTILLAASFRLLFDSLSYRLKKLSLRRRRRRAQCFIISRLAGDEADIVAGTEYVIFPLFAIRCAAAMRY